MSLKHLLIIFAVTIIALGCRDEAVAGESRELPKDFTLEAGEKVLFNNVEFQFERVKQDSRCPKGTQCIQKGKAEVVVNYTLDKTPVQKIMVVGASDSDKQLEIQGMTVQLGFLKPYPATNIKIDPANYTAHFIVSKGNSLKGAAVMDVRTQEEFDAGHFTGALHIPYDDIADRVSELPFEKDDLVVVYCRSGNRAAKAKATLNQLGYTNVINGVDQDTAEQLVDDEE